MNIRLHFLVRVFGVLLAAGAALAGMAQGKQKSLTRDFDKLPAKERSRLAAEETARAGQDTAYQRLMHEGDGHFRDGRYEEALAVFSRARELRPYNVYPKVKIEDLQALIRKRDAAAQPPSVPAGPTPAPDPPPPPPDSGPPPQAEEAGPVPVPSAAPASPVPDAPPVPPSAPVIPPPSLPEAPPTMGERVYKEAGALVTERTVEDDGKPVVYKKVVHPWGQTFYFKDGLSIPGRLWRERFSGPVH